MQPVLKTLAGAAAALALCISPTMAAAATISYQPISPLVVVSVFGTQASAQTVCSQAASAAAAAGAAAAAQGQAGCVLPVTDLPPPVGQAPAAAPPTGNFGVNWLLLGLGTIALLAGISTLFDDDDDVDITPISPS